MKIFHKFEKNDFAFQVSVANFPLLPTISIINKYNLLFHRYKTKFASRKRERSEKFFLEKRKILKFLFFTFILIS